MAGTNVTLTATTCKPGQGVLIEIDSSGVENGGDCFQITLYDDVAGSFDANELLIGDVLGNCETANYVTWYAPGVEITATITADVSASTVAFPNGQAIEVAYGHADCQITPAAATVKQGGTVNVEFFVAADYGGESWHNVEVTLSDGTNDFQSSDFSPQLFIITDSTGGTPIVNVTLTVPVGQPLGTYTFVASADLGELADQLFFNFPTITVVPGYNKGGGFLAFFA